MLQRGADIASFRSIKVPVQIACKDMYIVAATILSKRHGPAQAEKYPSARQAPRRMRSNGDPEIMRDQCPDAHSNSSGIILHEWGVAAGE